ncbi:MAG: hypothetical protein IJD92_05260 [Bacilli bacterium]|nr:hypothetical protein [Bacilli bacterium]
MKNQYIVQSSNINDRKNFYNFLIDNGYIPVANFKHQNFINNKFPFVVESNKTFWICESITCCAAAASCGAIISIDEYFNIIKNNDSKLVLKLSHYKKIK